MEIGVRAAGDVRILDLSGDLMLGAGDLVLRQTVKRLIEERRAKIVLNLEALVRVDSSGVGEILACKRAAQTAGGDVKLLNPSEKVHRILLTSRLAEVLHVHDEETDAVSSFSARQ